MSPLVLLADRRGSAREVMIGAIVLMTATVAGLALVDGYVGVLGLMVAFFVAFNLLEVQLPAYLSRVVPAGLRGTGMGVYSSFQFCGTFLGGVAGGYLLTVGDLSLLMCVNAVLGIGWIGLSLRIDELSNVESRTLDMRRYGSLSANQLLEALSSVRGVTDVVLVENEGVAYLKIDNASFNEDDLLQHLLQPGNGR
jgi:MFS family permease